MPKRRIEFRGELGELHDLFIEILEDAEFQILTDKSSSESIRIIGMNRGRSSQLTSTLFSIIGGYVEKNRIGVELYAMKKGGIIVGALRCSPYLSSFDMEVSAEGKDLEKCRNLLRLFRDKIKSEYDQ
ncbi:MAG: hypothetical protein ACLFVP_07395 [Candidatus Bathyarchaeia archaeon]